MKINFTYNKEKDIIKKYIHFCKDVIFDNK